MTIQYEAIEFGTASEALQHVNAEPRPLAAILIDGKPCVVDDATAERLEIAGVPFAYLHDHEMPDGSFRIMTVPVND